MEGVCPSCNIVYEKVQCGLFWSPTLELLPSTISKAYVIISDTKIYAVNKATKNILTEKYRIQNYRIGRNSLLHR